VILRRLSSRRAIWAFAAVLLLKAAMPLLATASAHAQGKTLVEVCTVYGVALVPLGGQGGEPAPDPAAAHGGEHCALTALAVSALAGPQTLGAVTGAQPDDATAPESAPTRARDACASWVARLGHGPPATA
jgi:hypothetical protein